MMDKDIHGSRANRLSTDIHRNQEGKKGKKIRPKTSHVTTFGLDLDRL